MTRVRDFRYILLIILLFPVLSFSQDNIIVNSEGVSSIIAGNEIRARDIAIEDALRRAVEQALGTFISSEAIVENSVLISKSIYCQSRGYVKKYTVLKEVSDADLYRVTLESEVSTTKIHDDLAAIGLLMKRKHKPRIMVVIPEYHILRKVPDPAGETEIIRRFLEEGFMLVDQSQVARIRYNDQLRAGFKGDAMLAARIGLEYGAEVIIIGEAFSESAGEIVSGFTTCRARVEARMIRTDTAEIMAADGKHATALDVAEVIAGKKALTKAGGEIATSFIEQILACWSSDVTSTTNINMVIIGLNYKNFIRFKRVILNSLRGVEKVHQRSFSQGRAVIDLDIKGDTQSLSEELTLRDFAGFNLEITDFSANRLMVKVRTE
ncbi:hypothetical protein KAI46_10665 [bacterium]|nr:hypothetical protein [bacterium]